jgi:hypothetical protein
MEWGSESIRACSVYNFGSGDVIKITRLGVMDRRLKGYQEVIVVIEGLGGQVSTSLASTHSQAFLLYSLAFNSGFRSL